MTAKSVKHQWLRVGKREPCPVCGKPDWCTVCPELSLILCMRMESARPSKNALGGWLHPLGNAASKPLPPVRRKPEVKINAHALWQHWKQATPVNRLLGLAESLGVEPIALHILGCAWAPPHNAFAFPMRNGTGAVVGIRLRNLSGDKWAVQGSHAGLFIPDAPSHPTLYIVEGVTDCAAALTMGLYAIGRPSCSGNETDVQILLARQRTQNVVICADNDESGQRGATKLQAVLKVSSCIWTPPAKDVRAFANAGGTADTVRSLVKNLVWRPATEDTGTWTPTLPSTQRGDPSSQCKVVCNVNPK